MDLSDFENEFLAAFVLDYLDYAAQLRSIHSLVRVHRKADKKLAEEIREIEDFAKRSSGTANAQALDELVDRLHDSVYQDAAHSMAAVGMLAPFVESLFKQAFLGIRDMLVRNDRLPTGHPRWAMKEDKRWDCRFSLKTRGRNLVAGIIELADATGLANDLPRDFRLTLSALFGYRNRMFHFGFEWPVEEREAFEALIADAGWPSDWFSKATSDDKPWIFYMSDAFVDHSLATIEEVLSGLGAFVRRNN